MGDQHKIDPHGSQIPSKIKMIEMKLLSHEENFKTLNKVVSAIQAFIDSQEETNNEESRTLKQFKTKLDTLADDFALLDQKQGAPEIFEARLSESFEQIRRTDLRVEELRTEARNMDAQIQETEKEVAELRGQLDRKDAQMCCLERQFDLALEQAKKSENDVMRERQSLRSIGDELSEQLESTLAKTTSDCQYLQSQSEQMAETIRRLQ
jgi:chromosome segregation ATPase